MNSTILEIRKSAVLVFIALLAGVSTAFGQSDTSWQAIGIDTVLTNKHVNINNTLDVHGKITADSMRVRGALHIGDSSLTLVNDVYDGIVRSDHIRSTQGRIALFGDDGSGNVG